MFQPNTVSIWEQRRSELHRSLL